MYEDTRKAVYDILKEVEEYGEADTVTLFELKTILHDRGFGVFMLLFSLPLSIPIPTIPGYTTILSLPLILFSVQMSMGRDTPWLPDFLDKKSFKREFLTAVVEKTSTLLKAMERWTKPRLMFIFCGAGKRVLALICLLCALSIAIPLPLTNNIPAAGISAIALGMLSRDGVLAVLGIVLGLLGLLITTVVLIAGPKLVAETFSFVSKVFADVPKLGNYSTMAASISVFATMYLFILIIVLSRIHASANLTSNKAESLMVADCALSNSLKLLLQNSTEIRTEKYIDDATSSQHLRPPNSTCDTLLPLTEATGHVRPYKPHQDHDDIDLVDNSTHLTDISVTSVAYPIAENQTCSLRKRSGQPFFHHSR